MAERLSPAITIRAFDPAADDVALLTDLLHRAYAPLAARGLRFMATHQTPATTLRRIEGGACYLAERAGQLAGTITFRPAAATGGCLFYDRPDVASFGQFAVDPAVQHVGIGSALLTFVERRAAEAGTAELALDTAEPAADLIAFYARRGYRIVGHAQWQDVNYRSVIMSKRVGGRPIT
jgi:GNAT superfamily N-acetyltransferase